MSPKSLAKTEEEILWEKIEEFRASHGGGGVRLQDVAEWIDKNNLLPKPKISAVRIYTRNLKQVASRRRSRDAQGRMVRPIIPAKFEATDRNGNLYFEVVWDFLHEASATHQGFEAIIFSACVC